LADHYQISLALAGFSRVTAEQNAVTVAGDKAEKTGRDFMCQDISTGRFKWPVQPCRLCE
jgi:molecular chaperone IbpA